MLRRAIRPLMMAGFGLIPVACASGGGGTITPAQHGATSQGHTTKATFTIHWTNPTAPASVRHRDTISPSAQSVSVTVNGNLAAVENRASGTQQQSFQFAAPVGTDAFVFNVYDAPNAQGNLLGSATVAQQIIDGAANVVSASIQAVCSVTNVSYAGDDPPSTVQTITTGIQPPQLSQIELLGALPATLIVAPEDVDGNVIIGSTTGQIAYQISGTATVAPIDGAHLALHPFAGTGRSLTASTLTVVAPSCPATSPATIAVKRSPAIYVETNSYVVNLFDWYGNVIETFGLPTGSTLIGWDTVSHLLMAYASSTGQVTGFQLNTSPVGTLYTVPTGTTATWSNYLHGPLLAQQGSGYVEYYDYTPANGLIAFGSASGTNVAVATSTLSSYPFVLAGTSLGIGGFTLTANGGSNPTGSVSATDPYTALATDDHLFIVYSFNSSGSYVCKYLYSPAADGCSNFGFTGIPAIGATDTDADDVYAVVGGNLEASAANGLALGGFSVNNVGTTIAIVVISANEQ